MAEIILVRHGETRFNREEVFRGTVDVALSPHGLAQADALARALGRTPLEAVYSSPLSRAVQTARAVAEERGLAASLVDGFTDMHFGPWEGLPLKEVQRRFPREFRLWMRTPHLFRPRGGERLAGVRRRAVKALREVAHRHRGAVLVVTHRVVTKLLILWVLGQGAQEFWSVRQDTACINRFSLERGRRILTLMNDTCHLAELEGAGRLRDF